VTLDDPVYPPALLTMPDPPALLYIKGRLDLLHAKGVALVGSRSATPQGVEDAERFARALSEAGLAVVSGLAPGIDGAARRGAMAGRGSAIAVIGTCANLVYPAAHQPLARQIAAADEADPGPGVQKPLAAPGHAPATLEIPAARTDMQDAALQGTLLQPELAGHLTVLPGGRLARASHG
jgi:predicted Rossmann fold nucleotide-binding protein DprA/Smf involved in DNA uptake